MIIAEKVFIIGLQGEVGSEVEKQIPLLFRKDSSGISRIGGEGAVNKNIENQLSQIVINSALS